MLNKIIDALGSVGISAYIINETTVKTAELFFIKKKLDMRRMNNSHFYDVVVYRDFDKNGVKMRGFTSVRIHPSMNDTEISEALSSAYYGAQFVCNPYFEPVKGEKEEHIDMQSDLSDLSLSESAMLMAKALFSADNAEDAFINSAEIFSSRTDYRIVTSEGIDVSYTSYGVKGEFVVQCISPEDVEMYHDFSYLEMNTEALASLAANAIASVRDRAKATVSPAAGKYTVLLSGKQTADIFSYYTARSGASSIFAKYSNFALGCDVQGENVKGERIDLSGKAVAPYSNDGIRMTDRRIIENGKLCLIHGATRFCRYLGTEPTGTYTKYCSDNGTVSFEDMKKEPYLHVVSFSDFSMDPFSGHFGGEIRLAYLYDGSTVTPVTGGSISGNLLECQSDLVFSTERYTNARYDGPFAVRLLDVSVAGSQS